MSRQCYDMVCLERPPLFRALRNDEQTDPDNARLILTYFDKVCLVAALMIGSKGEEKTNRGNTRLSLTCFDMVCLARPLKIGSSRKKLSVQDTYAVL